MARIRNIKPGFFSNEDLAELPAMTRLLFIGLWTLADRRGRLEDRPKRIQAALFPYDQIDADKIIGELEVNGFLERYQSTLATGEIQKLIQITNFEKHQRISGEEASKESVYSPPIKEVPTTKEDIIQEPPEENTRSRQEASPCADLGLRTYDLGLRTRVPAAEATALVETSLPVLKPEPEKPKRPPEHLKIFDPLWVGLIVDHGIILTTNDRKVQARQCWQLVDRIRAQFGEIDAPDAARGIVGAFLRFRSEDRSQRGFWRTQSPTPLALSGQSVWGPCLEAMREQKPPELSPEEISFRARMLEVAR